MAGLPINNFAFHQEHLPGLAASNAVFLQGYNKFKECLGNPEVIRCYALHYDPPANYKTVNVVLSPPVIDAAKVDEIRNYLASLTLTITLHDLPNMYARYNPVSDEIEMNATLFGRCADPGAPGNRYAFLIWRKLLHELAHRVLYLRVLRLNAQAEGYATPPGLFSGESGNTFERFMNGGVFTHSGRGMTTCKQVRVTPMYQPVILIVPDAWIDTFFNHSVHNDTLASFQVDLGWQVPINVAHKRKRAIVVDSQQEFIIENDEPAENDVSLLQKEEQFEIIRSYNY